MVADLRKGCRIQSFYFLLHKLCALDSLPDRIFVRQMGLTGESFV